ncbi:hypothetical protein A3C26_00450 [Candidatus Daviesbacteria bacterium RIFCSPHIGHO2_02_FULL_39_12]|uniref:ATP synthase F1 complex delta/epsilon subunit N-terminal domain-containing protein n=2 Tax=Candidatus Daviesiibacteriota TaxID=1752718 RepID=A0A1F5J8W2_9BACT|nr:MAG: hypothetical protein A3C26_00450 [Candidatus Daviesbacteria bacterium RIFCSPHIGHO2_02_FULL_39_12]OGE72315.1 MAG: hypothetical protein A3H40_02380 [Candidatus Daviesbacteria bacterium RIFCSPLOWO2_02_FULL_38_15]
MNPNTAKLQLTIIHPDEESFTREVDVVSSSNLEGPFDVWPLHTNFISIIKDYLWVYQGKEKIMEIKVDTGILRVTSNRVEVFLGIDTLNPK